MPAGHRQPEPVEPVAHLLRRVAVQVEELDTLVAHLGNRAQRTVKVGSALVAHGVEHQADAAHVVGLP